MLKRCLDDFTGNNIDVACELIESAGAFMLRQQATLPRMHNMLTVRALVGHCRPQSFPTCSLLRKAHGDMLRKSSQSD